MATPIFDYYQYAQQQATTVSDMLGVARHVVQRRQENRRIKAEMAQQMAEQMHERMLQQDKFEMDMYKTRFQEEQRNLRAGGFIGATRERTQIARDRLNFDISRYEQDGMTKAAKDRFELALKRSQELNQYARDVYRETGIGEYGFGLPISDIQVEQTDDGPNYYPFIRMMLDDGSFRVFTDELQLSRELTLFSQATKRTDDWMDNAHLLYTSEEVEKTERGFTSLEEVEDMYSQLRNRTLPFEYRLQLAAGIEGMNVQMKEEKETQALDTANRRTADEELKELGSYLELMGTHIEKHRYDARLAPWSWGRRSGREVDVEGVSIHQLQKNVNQAKSRFWSNLERTFDLKPDDTERFKELVGDAVKNITLTQGSFNPREWGYYIDNGQWILGRLPETIVDQETEDTARTGTPDGMEEDATMEYIETRRRNHLDDAEGYIDFFNNR